MDYLLRVALATLFWLLPVMAGAQSAASYPSKPVRVIVPFAQGGATTLVTTLFGERFAKELGQNFIADHRPGGDSIIGTALVAKATPDGYTLLTNSSAILVNHWLQPDLTFDVLKELAPVATLTRSDSILIVHPSLPVSDLKSFIAYARANPGKVNVASSSTVVVLFYQMFMNATGTRLTVVNYKGGGQIMPDLLSGSVQGFMSNVLNIQVFAASGKVKGLAIAGAKRAALLPDVPTFAESGMPDYDPANWLALFAPSRTPRDIVEKLNSQVRRAQSSGEVVSTLDKLGLAAYPMTLAQTEGFYRTESDRFGRVIRESGLKAGDI